jgi:prepilin-type N-terminal cleavage/methylation domain-containing protein
MGISESRPAANPGFTIIEVLIVLLIAGMIFLIIFGAVPTLERNSRNNQRRQDIQSILEAVSHYELNNSGNLPGVASNFLQYSKLNYYNQAAVQYNSTPPAGVGVYVFADSASSPPAIPANNSLETVQVYNYQKCSATNQDIPTKVGAGYNDVVALYAIETGQTTHAGQCQQL